MSSWIFRTLTYCSESLIKVSSKVESTNRLVASVDKQTENCIAGQNAAAKTARSESEAQAKRFDTLQQEATNTTAAVKENNNIILDVQKKLQR